MLRRAISVAAAMICGAVVITGCGFVDDDTAVPTLGDPTVDDATSVPSSEEDPYEWWERDERWEYDNLGETTFATPTAIALPTAVTKTTTATATATKTQTATKTATQTATQTQSVQWPAPPYPAPQNTPRPMEWTIKGPYGTGTSTNCIQIQEQWPSGTSECFLMPDGWYFYGLVQSM